MLRRLARDFGGFMRLILFIILLILFILPVFITRYNYEGGVVSAILLASVVTSMFNIKGGVDGWRK